MKFRSALAIAAALLALASSVSVSAREIYRWVDADGVVSFSSTPPQAAVDDVERMTIDEPAADPGGTAEDVFNIAATAERTRELREDLQERLAERRAARLERERLAAQQTVTHRFEEAAPGYPWYGFRPHRPPVKPRPPIARPEPLPAVPFTPPGDGRQ
jgi:hypothetical protein